MERCIWPILKPKTSNSDPEADKIHHMAKIVDLFQCWADQEQYRTLFFLTGHGMFVEWRNTTIKKTTKNLTIVYHVHFMRKWRKYANLKRIKFFCFFCKTHNVQGHRRIQNRGFKKLFIKIKIWTKNSNSIV